MSDVPQENAQIPDKDKRIDFYLKVLARLKERSTLREVLEREVFLEFIKYNNNRINEFPCSRNSRAGLSRFYVTVPLISHLTNISRRFSVNSS